MNNIHNFNRFSPNPSKLDHSRLLFIIAIAVILIGGELVWFEIRKTGFDIDGYSATIFSAVPNRDIMEANNLGAEVGAVETGDDLDGDFMNIDAGINSL